MVFVTAPVGLARPVVDRHAEPGPRRQRQVFLRGLVSHESRHFLARGLDGLLEPAEQARGFLFRPVDRLRGALGRQPLEEIRLPAFRDVLDPLVGRLEALVAVHDLLEALGVAFDRIAAEGAHGVLHERRRAAQLLLDRHDLGVAGSRVPGLEFFEAVDDALEVLERHGVHFLEVDLVERLAVSRKARVLVGPAGVHPQDARLAGGDGAVAQHLLVLQERGVLPDLRVEDRGDLRARVEKPVEALLRLGVFSDGQIDARRAVVGKRRHLPGRPFLLKRRALVERLHHRLVAPLVHGACAPLGHAGRHPVEAFRDGQGRKDHVDDLDAGIEIIPLHPGLHGPPGGHPAPEDLGGEVGEGVAPVGRRHDRVVIGHPLLAEVEGLERGALPDAAQDTLVEIPVDPGDVDGELQRDPAVLERDLVAQGAQLLHGGVVHDVEQVVEAVDRFVGRLVQFDHLLPDRGGVDLEHVRVVGGPLQELVDLLHLLGRKRERALEVALQLGHFRPCRLGKGNARLLEDLILVLQVVEELLALGVALLPGLVALADELLAGPDALGDVVADQLRRPPAQLVERGLRVLRPPLAQESRGDLNRPLDLLFRGVSFVLLHRGDRLDGLDERRVLGFQGEPGHLLEELSVVGAAAVDVLGDLDDLLEDGELAADGIDGHVPQKLEAHPGLHGRLRLRPPLAEDLVEDVLACPLLVFGVLEHGEHDDLLVLGHEGLFDLAVHVLQLVHLAAADGVDLGPLGAVVADVDRFRRRAVGRSQRVDVDHVEVEHPLDLLLEEIAQLFGVLHVDHDDGEIDVPLEAHGRLGLRGPAAHVHLRPHVGQIGVELDVAGERLFPGRVDALLPGVHQIALIGGELPLPVLLALRDRIARGPLLLGDEPLALLLDHMGLVSDEVLDGNPLVAHVLEKPGRVDPPGAELLEQQLRLLELRVRFRLPPRRRRLDRAFPGD